MWPATVVLNEIQRAASYTFYLNATRGDSLRVSHLCLVTDLREERACFDTYLRGWGEGKEAWQRLAAGSCERYLLCCDITQTRLNQ